jgi:Uncharacterized conserved protein (COG2071).
LPVPLHRDFDEVNLCFYVRHVTPAGEQRRGVTFVRELVPRRAGGDGGKGFSSTAARASAVPC